MDLRQMKLSERLDYLESIRKIKLRQIRQLTPDKKEIVHCENLIGLTTLPLGVAGPLIIKDLEFRIRNYFIPLATTEGALVASVNRGCKAINLSGGAMSAVEVVGVTRGPVFETQGIRQSLELKKWLDDNLLLLKKTAKKTSSHLSLIKVETRITGHLAYVRFYFDTQEAMGMNMATIATDSMIRIIKAKTKVKCLSITGNFCVDKKPSWLNFIAGRGKRIWAEITIKKQVLKDILKTTPKKLYETWLSKCLVGSIMSGSMAYNAHFANVVAAFFAATGQDLAHVVEGSLGITTMKIVKNNDLYVSIYLPDVMVGIVGGGTKLTVKQEALKVIGAKSSIEYAQVLGGAVLAGEISLLASLSEGSLAKAHKKLGR